MSMLVNEIYPTFNYSLWLYTVAFSGLNSTLGFIYSLGNGLELLLLGVAFNTFYPSNKYWILVLFFQINP